MIAHSAHVMTLANGIIGVGILAMPFCFQKCGIILATLLLIASNWITRISCHYLIKCSLLTRRKSYEFLGFHAFGTSGKLLVELCIIGYLLGTCITYFVVVGDLGPQIVTKILSLDGGHLHLRTLIMIAVTLVCILPLGMLKNVDSLATVCTASIGFYVCLVVKIVLESAEHIITGDWSKEVVYWQPGGILQCLPIFSMALSCQMQLFEVFESINNQSLDKLNGIVRHATWICTCVYIAVGFFGYVAFCTQTFSGNILMNLSESFGSDVIKVGFVLSVAFSFPLVIFPCRASIYSLLYRKGHTDASGYIPESRFKAITIFIVGFALCVALMIPSVELVIGLVGSTIGVAICIMFPASCYRKIVQKDSTERMFAHFILVSGFCLMILGTYANLSAIDAKHSGAHLAVPPAKAEEILVTLSTLPAVKFKVDDKESVDHKNLSQTHKDVSIKLSEKFNKPVEVLGIEEIEKLKSAREKLANPEKIENVKKLPFSTPPPPPLLPIDEKHAPPEKEKIVSDFPPAKLQTENKPGVNSLAVNTTMPPHDSFKEHAKIKDQALKPQTINKDAINKDEEITAEEIRNDEKSKANEELKKTQNELKKAKELLQRTVGELKEELAKQNEETQNLVVEKLDAVVEKVNQIERDVKQRNKEERKTESKQIERDALQESMENSKDSVVSMIAEEKKANANSGTNRSATLNKISDAVSSKKPNRSESIRNSGKFEQQYLAVPLPLLVNGSLSKSKDETYIRDAITQERDVATLKPGAAGADLKEQELKVEKEQRQQQSKDFMMATKSENEKLKVAPKGATQINIAANKDNETAQKKIDLIHRDLLQARSEHLENTLTSNAAPALPAKEQRERAKRSNHQIIDAVSLKEMERCDDLRAVNMPNKHLLLAAGVNNAVNLKFGRELKSVDDETTKR